MYSWLTSINSSIIWVRYSLLMKGLEIPIVNGPSPPAGASVAGSSVEPGASVAAGASVVGAWVAGASVAGVAQAAIRDRIATITVISRTNFLLFADMFIFSYFLSFFRQQIQGTFER